MKRFLCAWMALGLLVGGVGQVRPQGGYVLTPIDYRRARRDRLGVVAA